MPMLDGFPRVDEKTPVTGDHFPSENSSLNCVPACLCAGAMYLNKKTLGGDYTPDSLKDAVYGQGYVGGMSARAFIDHMKDHFGIKLWSYASPANVDLIEEAHYQISQGFPVIFTEPNPYGNPNYTHVCVFCGDLFGGLTAMDPWICQFVTRSDSNWKDLLLYGEVWIMEPTMKVPTGWHDDGHTLTAPNNIPVILGFRQYVLSQRWDPNNYPLAKEEAANPLESSNLSLGNGTRQTFRKSRLEWTQARGVFEGWIGQELLKVETDLQNCLHPPAAP